MEKYKKVKPTREELPDNIIRISRRTQPKVFVDKIIELLTEKKTPEVTISSLGDAIANAVTIVEIVKHRLVGVHQTNEISTLNIVDEFEPMEEGLDKLFVDRKLTCLKIHLSLTSPKIKGHGY